MISFDQIPVYYDYFKNAISNYNFKEPICIIMVCISTKKQNNF